MSSADQIGKLKKALIDRMWHREAGYYGPIELPADYEEFLREKGFRAPGTIIKRPLLGAVRVKRSARHVGEERLYTELGYDPDLLRPVLRDIWNKGDRAVEAETAAASRPNARSLGLRTERLTEKEISVLKAIDGVRDIKGQIELAKVGSLLDPKANAVEAALNVAITDALLASGDTVFVPEVPTAQVVKFGTKLFTQDHVTSPAYWDKYFSGSAEHDLILVGVPEDIQSLIPQKYKTEKRILIAGKDVTIGQAVVANLGKYERFTVVSDTEEDLGELANIEKVYQMIYDRETLDQYDWVKPLVLESGKQVARFGEPVARELKSQGVDREVRTFFYNLETVQRLLDRLMQKAFETREAKVSA